MTRDLGTDSAGAGIIITTIRDRSDLPTSERLCRDTETRYSGNAVSVSVSANSHSFLASS
jgi:hypothetical protein